MKIFLIFALLSSVIASAQEIIQVKHYAEDGPFNSEPIILNAGESLTVHVIASDRDRAVTYGVNAEDRDGETYGLWNNRVLPPLVKRSTQTVTVSLGSPTPGLWALITITINRAPSEVELVNPANLLVLPENSSGDHDIIIETSNDLLEWTPFFSQTVNGQTARRFFRTRVVKRND